MYVKLSWRPEGGRKIEAIMVVQPAIFDLPDHGFFTSDLFPQVPMEMIYGE